MSRSKAILASPFLVLALVAGCDNNNKPSVDASKADADQAASSAMNAARAAAVNTGEALKDTAIAAKHEADAAVVKAQQDASNGNLSGSLQKAGDEAKAAMQDAKERVQSDINNASSGH